MYSPIATTRPLLLAERGFLCWELYHFCGDAVEGDLDGGERVGALVGHGLEGAGDSTVGLGVAEGSDAPGDCLPDFGHADIALMPPAEHLAVESG